jgi:pimeloyl-ACP methyl ester carboxylesterase
MEKIKSKDGTFLAFDRSGKGPALIIVNGAMSTRAAISSANQGPGDDLARHFSVFAYDRRGRGDSEDAQPQAVEREIEDIDVLIREAGGKAFVFGHSSGAVLALEAARMLPDRITRLAVYEPPFIIEDSRPPLPEDFVARLKELAAAGDRGGMVETFMTAAIGMPPAVVAQMRAGPMWPGMEAVAPSLIYDGLVMENFMRGNPADIQRWAGVRVPTLVMDGGESPAYMQHAAEVLASVLPNAIHRQYAGQSHGVANDVLVAALVEFFIGK